MIIIQNETLNQIQEADNGRFKNAVEFVDDKTVIVYAMNREYEIHEILFDLEDLPRIVGRYSSMSLGGEGYAYGVIRGTGRVERVHRFIFGDVQDGLVVHHQNGNKIDNRKFNLREVTRKENNQGFKIATASSGFRNVYQSASGKYFVQVMKDGVAHHYGTYPTAEAANEVAKAKRIELFGDL